MSRDVVIGLLGLGVIGSGVWKALNEKADFLSNQMGRSVRIKRIAEKNPERQRLLGIDASLVASDASAILDDPEINVVIELIGGEEPARTFIHRALSNGKYVVTANKEVVSKHGVELLELARSRGVGLNFEASVGGGIPLIGSFKQDLAANRILSLRAIINGTTNYILTRMAQDGTEFDVALKQAQELGYAEANPTNDVEGIDAVYKLAILSTLAFRVRVRPEDIYREGITRLHPRDFQYARELGYAIKLLAIGKRVGDGVEVRVHPAFVPTGQLLAQVNDVFNAVHVEGDLVGSVIFYGRGAGPSPTSSAIIADVIDAAQSMDSKQVAWPQFKLSTSLAVRPMEDVHTRYYLRIQVVDRPGVLAQIATVFGNNDISMASVIQKEVHDVAPDAEIVIMTHTAREGHVQKALAELRDLPCVKEIHNFTRVEG
jgi:homoserine dehydrogenase